MAAIVGTAFRRDVVAVACVQNVLWDAAQTRRLGTDEAIALLWTVPWDGQESMPLSRLHPLFVEICRRVRLVRREENLFARIANSDHSRVDAKHLHGDLADPWAPIERSDSPRALSITAEALSYRRMNELLFGSSKRSWRLPLLARARGREGVSALQIVGAGIASRQGKGISPPGRGLWLHSRELQTVRGRRIHQSSAADALDPPALMDEGTNAERLSEVDVRPNAGIVRSPLDEIKAIRTLLADVYKDAGDGRTLFRELVQNADDAGAQRLRLVVLERGWPDARNSLLRGPALLVANDGAFPDKDRKALHKAIGGSKEAEVGKIGTFGIGLKSVFHI